MQKKLVLSVLACFVVGVAAVAIFRHKPKDVPTRIAFVVTTLSNPFFVEMTEGAKVEAQKHLGMELVVQAPETAADNERQIQIIENLISQRVAAVCIVPADSRSVVTALAKAKAAGIPIINVDNKIDAVTLKAAGLEQPPYIGSDNFSGGKLAGEFVISKLGGKGKVAILEGVSGVEAGIKRKTGFLEAMKAAPGITVVASQPADWNREKGLNVFQSIYQANPDLGALFACNDEMALGAIRALKVPRTVIVVGFDATKDALDALRRKEIDATVAQVPREMGRLGFATAVDIIAGKKANPHVETALRLVTE